MDTAEFVKQGLGWAVAVVLGGVIYYLFKRLEALYKEKEEIQESRRQDIIGFIEKYNAAMGDFSQTAKLLLAKLSGEK